jgi:hypothetical protein
MRRVTSSMGRIPVRFKFVTVSPLFAATSASTLGEHDIDHVHYEALPGLGRAPDAIQLPRQLGRETARTT